jgi:hypothetical protein
MLQTLQPFVGSFDEPQVGAPCRVYTDDGGVIDLSSIPLTDFAVTRPPPPPPPPSPPGPSPPFSCPSDPALPRGCLSDCVSTPLHGGGHPWVSNVVFATPFQTGVPVVSFTGLWNTFKNVTTKGTCCGNTFNVTAVNTSRTGFELELTRTDQPTGFGAQMHVRWRACPSTVTNANGLSSSSSSAPMAWSVGSAATVQDVYRVGFCQMLRCPTPGMVYNFGYALRHVSGDADNCDKAWPGPLVPAYLAPTLMPSGDVVLRPSAVTDDGIAAPSTTGQLEVVLVCDPSGAAGVASPTNATLIDPNSTTDESAHYVAHRLEFKSKCACPGGCTSGSGGGTRHPTSTANSDSEPTSPMSAASTMPADGSYIVRLHHLYGSAEGLGAMSEPATVDLASIFCRLNKTIDAVQEVSITANQKIEDVRHWDWRHQSFRASRATTQSRVTVVNNGSALVVLQPLSTRTFVVTVAL